jgi:GLPGLI family protein
MKTKMMLVLAMVGAGFNLSAQDKTQGKVNYEVSLNLHASLKPDQLQFKDLIPEFSTSEEILYFNGNLAKIERVSPDEQEGEDGVKIKMDFGGGKKGMYSDGTAEGTYYLIEKEGKKSLQAISDQADKKEDSKKNKSGKTKEILGFTCQSVISGDVTLWISKELPFKIGPFGLFSKEGAILGLEMKVGKAYATSIDYVPVKTEDLVVPKDLPIEKKS